MSTVRYTEQFLGPGSVLVTWAGLRNGDIGQPYKIAGAYPTKTFQVTGTFGSGGVVDIEGTNGSPSNPSPTWILVQNQADNSNLSLTDSALYVPLQNPVQIRPNVSDGDTDTLLDVQMTANVVAELGQVSTPIPIEIGVGVTDGAEGSILFVDGNQRLAQDTDLAVPGDAAVSGNGQVSGTLLVSGKLTLSNVLQQTGVAFASLPASPAAGMIAYVTDSNTVTWGATIAGGSTNKVTAQYNGTNWTVVAK